MSTEVDPRTLEEGSKEQSTKKNIVFIVTDYHCSSILILNLDGNGSYLVTLNFQSKMSIFGFGKKKDNAPSTGDAIQRLRETEDMLLRKQVQRHEFLNHLLQIQTFVFRNFWRKKLNKNRQQLEKMPRPTKELLLTH